MRCPERHNFKSYLILSYLSSDGILSSIWFRIPFLDGGWTTKIPADGNKALSLPKSICSQEVVSSFLGKDLSYSGRDHITVKDCFWNARLVKKYS